MVGLLVGYYLDGFVQLVVVGFLPSCAGDDGILALESSSGGGGHCQLFCCSSGMSVRFVCELVGVIWKYV